MNRGQEVLLPAITDGADTLSVTTRSAERGAVKQARAWLFEGLGSISELAVIRASLQTGSVVATAAVMLSAALAPAPREPTVQTPVLEL